MPGLVISQSHLDGPYGKLDPVLNFIISIWFSKTLLLTGSSFTHCRSSENNGFIINFYLFQIAYYYIWLSLDKKNANKHKRANRSCWWTSTGKWEKSNQRSWDELKNCILSCEGWKGTFWVTADCKKSILRAADCPLYLIDWLLPAE